MSKWVKLICLLLAILMVLGTFVGVLLTVLR